MRDNAFLYLTNPTGSIGLVHMHKIKIIPKVLFTRSGCFLINGLSLWMMERRGDGTAALNGIRIRC
ncbi:hypothetical protein JYT92_00295 [bacterium AH-315-L15]|nr:hypothetical protein [bacterium AH-315-L15]